MRQENRRQTLEALDGTWRTAKEIAARAGVKEKAAIKVLALSVARGEDVDVKQAGYKDDRWRFIDRKMYRRPSMSSAERAQMLNDIFIFKRRV